MAFIPNRWMTLRFGFSGAFVQCKYSDSLGRVRELSWDRRDLPPSQIGPPPPSSASVFEFEDLIGRLTEGLPSSRWGDIPTDVAPLAVFIELPSGLTVPDLKKQLSLWPGFDPLRVQVVQLSRARHIQRSPFQLPLNLFAIGEATPRALSRIEESHWYASSAQVREFGLRIQNLRQTTPARPRIGASDILLADASSTVLERMHRLPASRRPRLVVVLDENFEKPSEFRAPAGVAVLRIPGVGSAPNVPQFLRAFTYGILHDFPLHEAVKSASLEVGPEFEPLLIADPLSNQSLRFADALSDLKRQNEKWEATLPELDFGALLSRIEKGRDLSLQDRLPDLRKRIFDLSSPEWKTRLSGLRNRASAARSLPAQFTHESDSLVPMASVKADFAQLASQSPSIQKVVNKIIADGDVAELLKAHQQRFVDVALARQETEPLLEPLSKSDTLQADKTYQLRVHIGNRLPDSLVVGPSVPVDPILPQKDDERGHHLEIVAQGKDFAVISSTTQKAFLPEFGATVPVYFKIRTPKEIGTKQLRICVYSRNYLIQAYQLTAVVTATESTATDSSSQSLTVKLEFSRTDKFSDLDEFRPRLLSIGANSSDHGHTHKLIFKDDDVSDEITLFPAGFADEVKKFRDTLETASMHPTNPELTRNYPSVVPGQRPENDVAQTFRELMKQGHELYDAVFGKFENSPLRPSLVKVKTGVPNEKLQVIRFDSSFVFPWSVLYDFDLPDDRYGKPSRVCLGFSDSVGNAIPCGHTFKDKVWCVNGFWGVRHYVEEMIGEGTNINPKIAKAPSAAVRIVADTTLIPAQDLIKNLNLSLGKTQVVDGPLDPDQLLDLLWADPPQRPSILIVLGHLAKKPVAGEPEGDRIVLVPKNKWLLRRKISERSSSEVAGWCQPRSLVLLMACESTATEVTTVNDFVTAWNTAGAGGIIGTECTVGADFAASLAEDVTMGLWNGKTLGEAMAGFRRKAVNAGNPLGLVFHAIGDMDLTVN